MSQTLLEQITEAAKTGGLTLEQVQNAYKAGDEQNPPAKTKSPFSLPKILTFVGGLIVFIGLSIIISVNWNTLNTISQILITLGLGFALFTVANLIFWKLKNYDFLGNCLHLIGAGLIPTGVFVVLSKLPPNNIKLDLIVGIVFLALLGLYILTDFLFKKSWAILIATIYGLISYWAFYGYINSFIDYQNLILDRLSGWAGLVSSISLGALAYVLWNSSRKWFAHISLLLSIVIGYVSIFSIVVYNEHITYSSTGSQLLEYLYGILFLPAFYLSSHLKSRWFIFVNTVALILWLIYLNTRYFFGKFDFGWNLVTSGLIIIGISLLSLNINKFLTR
jgi:Predicted membrane protein (DUF2157)